MIGPERRNTAFSTSIWDLGDFLIPLLLVGFYLKHILVST